MAFLPGWTSAPPRRRRPHGVCWRRILLGLAVLGAWGPAEAQFNLSGAQIASGLTLPTSVGAPVRDFARLFITEREGRIRILKNGVLLPTPFLDIRSKVSCCDGERGLFSMAFHPAYAVNGFFYVDYTDLQGRAIVERYSVSAGDPDVAEPLSARTILGPMQQVSSNHYGGCLQFGADGKLYISTGDAQVSLDAQDGTTLKGKILRLDVDLPPPYIPPDNPFVNDPNVLDEIWHLGLRNPWRFSFDRLTGDMYIGDVGQSLREEIDFQPAGIGGLNFGWPCMEGTLCKNIVGCPCYSPGHTMPIADYTHSGGISCVIGGYVYRGCEIPALRGFYVFGDFTPGIYCFTYDAMSEVSTIDLTGQIISPIGFFWVSSLGEDARGELLICDYSQGRVYKIVSNDPIVDCNNNGVQDACDIAAGTSLDSNNNGVPDECECAPVLAYCTAKVNSLGCLPMISWTGTPSASQSSGFVVECRNVINNKIGLLFYGTSGGASSPFQGGVLCIQSPVQRALPVYSGGNPPPDDCSGLFQFDMNAFASGSLGGSPLPLLRVVGTLVNCQWWGRDPGFPAPNNTTLSAGMEYTVCQ